VFNETGHGRAVVLLHSSMSSRNQWRALVEQLQSHYRVISIDLLGYGESRMRRRDTDYRLMDEARHVEAILAKTLLPCEKFHLVGHSYGGVVALSLAQRAPQRLSSLTLFEPIAAHLLPPRDPARQEFDQMVEMVRQGAAGGDAAAGAARFIDFWSGAGAFAALPELKQSAFATLLPKVLMEFRAVEQERRVTSWLRDLHAPVCLMHGSSSPAPARRVMAMLATLLPLARRIEFGAGHMAPVTHAEMVNPEIARFIANADAAESDAPQPAVAPQPQRRGWNWAKPLAVGLVALVCAGMSHSAAWHELPAGLSRGGRYAVVSGDPGAAGRVILRVELEPGFELPPHRVQGELQLVVLSGDLTIGRGTIRHPAGMRTMKSGYFASFGEHETWFASTEHGATLQIFSVGPIRS